VVTSRLTIHENVPLAPRCTLGVGGVARFFVEASDEETILAAHAWAQQRGVELRVLGGGSNLVVDDGGVTGLVVHVALRGVLAREVGDSVELTAAAGEPWDALVQRAVDAGWAGVECLSGIPGLVGATPIQNVGAYGQDVSETLTAVRVLDRTSGQIVTLDNDQCEFTYRDSVFKSRQPARYVVLGVSYRLRPAGAPTVRYAEVQRTLETRGIQAPSLAQVRECVLTIRRSKSMVLEPGDPNRRSCGSFFTNPIVSRADADRVAQAVGDPGMPCWPQPDGGVKLAAGWLIERAGFARGYSAGPVGLSTRHALAVVAHEGARASDVLAFARRLQGAVLERFGVRLVPEPVFWGTGAEA
jgi:UDP-N-acetylmuramate dehydrogenase